jgi:asparagine synthase (glutamine-hydrolysing)
MCGIAYLLMKEPGGKSTAEAGATLLKSDIAQMTKLVRHRGPDASVTRLEGLAALGHARLSIIDLSSKGLQPMSKDGEQWIVFNGEVYNYKELRQELSAYYSFNTATDTEVVLAAYMHWGPECLRRFIGMFSFVIWDSKTHRGFAARDRLGVKPMYYSHPQDSYALAIASEIKPLLYIGRGKPGVNSDLLLDFVYDRVLDHTGHTMYDGIEQLMPGCYMKWDREGKCSQERYWTYNPTRDVLLNESDAVRQFKELFEDSVRLRLRSDVPVGCMLSGGIDSSFVYCEARRQSRRAGAPLHTFTTVTNPPTEETEMIACMMEGERVEFHHNDLVDYDPQILESVEAVLRHQEEPFADGSMLAHYRLMRMCKESGIKVVLSGQGADEFWDGYYGSAWFLLASMISRREMRQAVEWARLFGGNYNFSNITMVKQALGHWLPPKYVDAYRRMAARRRATWIRKEFVGDHKRGRESERIAGEDSYRRYLRNIATAWSLPGFLHYEDRNSMAFGVEVRLPFLDHRLVEIAGSLDPMIKMKWGQTKYIVRRAGEGTVPTAVLRRHRKMAWPAPLEKWLRASPGLLNRIRETSPLVPFCDANEVNSLIKRFLDGDRSASTEVVWRMIITILWYEMFFLSGHP